MKIIPSNNATLTWSQKRPTKEGFYWVRYHGQNKEILRLARKEGSKTELTQMFYGERVTLRYLPKEFGFQWAGPIPEPVSPAAPELPPPAVTVSPLAT